MILVNLKRCVKKWSHFSKGVSKSGALFRKGCQKVTHHPRREKLSSKKVCQKWSTFPKGVSKSGVLSPKVRQKVAQFLRQHSFLEESWCFLENKRK